MHPWGSYTIAEMDDKNVLIRHLNGREYTMPREDFPEDAEVGDVFTATLVPDSKADGRPA